MDRVAPGGWAPHLHLLPEQRAASEARSPSGAQVPAAGGDPPRHLRGLISAENMKRAFLCMNTAASGDPRYGSAGTWSRQAGWGVGLTACGAPFSLGSGECLPPPAAGSSPAWGLAESKGSVVDVGVGQVPGEVALPGGSSAGCSPQGRVTHLCPPPPR